MFHTAVAHGYKFQIHLLATAARGRDSAEPGNDNFRRDTTISSELIEINAYVAALSQDDIWHEGLSHAPLLSVFFRHTDKSKGILSIQDGGRLLVNSS